ncbi:MAG: twin transmembrane helix small protein [Pseudomonadota bacterium]|nr:twin transmembrane helix small protein [Pseudomonadota bacterium]
MPIFKYLAFVAMAAVLVVLATGIISMIRAKGFHAKHGNRLMQLRVGTQAVAILMLVLYFLTGGA